MNLSHESPKRSPRMKATIGDIPKGIVYGNALTLLLIFLLVAVCLVFLPYPYGGGESILHHIFR